jgi:hypothetical protein
LLLIAATYTHFFGVVLAGLIWLSLLASVWIQQRPVRPPLFAALVYCAAVAGTLPFVGAALKLSEKADVSVPQAIVTPKRILYDTARLAFHLVSGSSAFAYPLVVALLFATTAGLLIAALLAAREIDQKVRGGVLPYLLLPALLAFVALPLLKLKIASFDVLSPHYNLWLVPLSALILAGAFASSSAKLRQFALGLASLLFAANLVSDTVLLRHPTVFSHGPGEWTAQNIVAPARTLVVHDGTGDWGQTYFPVFYLTHGQTTQILLARDGSKQLIQPDGLTGLPDWPADRFDRVLFIKTVATSTAELVAVLRGSNSCQPPPPRTVSLDFPATNTRAVYCAFESASSVVSDRTRR